MTSFSLFLKQSTEGQRETLQNYGGFRLQRQGKRKTLQLNLKILTREMIKEVSSCSSRYTKQAPQSQSGVNDSLKVISVHFLSPREQETETRERGTDLKIGSKSEKETDRECK